MATIIDTTTVKDIVDRWVAGWNGHDAAAAVEVCTHDMILDDPALPKPARGKDEVRRAMEAFFLSMPDIRIDDAAIYLPTEPASQALVHWNLSGTMRGPLEPPGFAPTNGRIEIEGASLLRFRGGLLCEDRLFYDGMSIGRQIGAAPLPGSVAERMGVAMQRMTARRMRRQA